MSTELLPVILRDYVPGVLDVPPLPHAAVCLHLGPPSRLAARMGGRNRCGTAIHGDIDIIPAGAPTRWEIGTADQGLILRVTPRLLETAHAIPSEIRDRFLIRDPRIEHIGWALRQEMEQGFPSGRLYHEGLAVALAAHLVVAHGAGTAPAEPEPRGGPRLKPLLSYIEEHLADDLSLAQIAAVAGLGASQTKAFFRRATGLPLHQYVIRRRVDRAAQLLRETSRPLVQVAMDCGFAHQSHLARHMRRLMGVSPAEYAQLHPNVRDRRAGPDAS